MFACWWNSPPNNFVLRIHLHSCNEVHTLHCPITKLSKVIVIPVQSKNSSLLEIEMPGSLAVIYLASVI